MMTTNNSTGMNGIEDMLLTAGTPCVSLIVSTSRLPAEKAYNHGAVKNALAEAKLLLGQHFPEAMEALMMQLHELVQKIDFAKMDEGLGIYVSSKVAKLVSFAFPVKSQVHVGESFIGRELLYNVQAMVEYYVLSVSRKNIRLFKGRMQELQEIRNEDFPMACEDEYEYERPARALSYASDNSKGYEREKSQMKDIRLKDVLRKADHAMAAYLQNSVPLVTSGGKKEVADFMQVTHHSKNVIARIPHYDHDTELAQMAWDQVQQYTALRKQQMLDGLHELMGRKLVVTGAKDVWKAANEGKGLELVLEKDFNHMNENKDDHSGQQEEGIIRKVLEKKGKVVFVNSGQLHDLGGIALRLRYE